MFKNYFLLNLLLILIITLLGARLHKTLTTNIEIPTKPTDASPRESEETLTRKSVHTDSSSYDVIVSSNLFHPSRSINKEPPEASQPVSKNEIPQLFGTIILNDNKLAILEDKSTKKSNLYNIDDSVSGFIVAQIMENKVILQKDGESIEVNLREDKKFSQPKRPQTRQRTIRKAPTKRRRPPVRRSRRR